jgi:antitoxin component YwqK of YwqJK toxin-antitoxin module
MGIAIVEATGSTCPGDSRSLTERLFLDKQGIIFWGRVMSFSFLPGKNPKTHPPEKYGNSLSGRADIEICSQYFGEPLPVRATFRSGNELKSGQDYLIFLRDTARHFGGHCDQWSKEITPGTEENEIRIITRFQSLIRSKANGYFWFQDAQGINLAEGEFKNGNAVGTWCHYYENGRLKSVHNLSKQREEQFNRDGILISKILKTGKEIHWENYSWHLPESVLNYERVSTETDSGTVIEEISTYYSGKLWSRYSYEAEPSGEVKKQSSYPMEHIEFYESGRLKRIDRKKNGLSIFLLRLNDDGSLIE